MEPNRRLDCPPEAEASVGSAEELTRSNSNASSLTAENCCKRSLLPPVNVNPDDNKAWTDEKHNLYLNQLEVSFVNQLHQSIDLFTKYSRPNRRDVDAPQRGPVYANCVSEQFTVSRNGCWQKINYERDPSPSRSSADSCNLRKSPLPYNLKHTDKQYPASRANKQQNHGKGMMSHGLAAYSQQPFAKNLMKEGIGQNFVEEDDPYQSNLQSRAKRLKIALTDAICYDQIKPSTKGPTTEYPEILTSNSGEQREEFVSGNT